jgi:hypothetical protein
MKMRENDDNDIALLIQVHEIISTLSRVIHNVIMYCLHALALCTPS